MRHIFSDILRIERKHSRKVALKNDATWKKKARWVLDAGARIISIGQEISQPLPILEPVAIEPSDGQYIRHIYLLHKSLCIGNQLVEQRDALGIDDRFWFIRIHRGRHAADKIGLGVRVFASQNCVDANELAL